MKTKLSPKMGGVLVLEELAKAAAAMDRVEARRRASTFAKATKEATMTPTTTREQAAAAAEQVSKSVHDLTALNAKRLGVHDPQVIARAEEAARAALALASMPFAKAVDRQLPAAKGGTVGTAVPMQRSLQREGYIPQPGRTAAGGATFGAAAGAPEIEREAARQRRAYGLPDQPPDEEAWGEDGGYSDMEKAILHLESTGEKAAFEREYLRIPAAYREQERGLAVARIRRRRALAGAR